MKRKIITSLVVLAVSAVSGYGVSKKLNSENDILQNLTLSNVEALSSSEWGFWDGVANTLKGQGWTKDEREDLQPCGDYRFELHSSIEGFGIKGSDSSIITVTNHGRKVILCPSGKDNCTSTSCN